MSLQAIGAIQAASTGEAWQALLQAALQEGAPALPLAEPTQAAEVAALATPETAALTAALPSALPSTLPSAPPSAPPNATAPVSPTARALEATPPLLRQPDAAAAVVPAAPVLLQPLHLAQGPELRWRATDAHAWRALFDDAGREGGDRPADETPDDLADLADLAAVRDAASAEPAPAWAQALLARLRSAAASPACAAALRPAVQAWCVGLPVLLASPAGLASLQASRDAAVWRWRRWPAHWRAARPASSERWWAVRLGLGPQGRPRTVRELAPLATGAPGQVSCELRLGDVAPGIAQWSAVLVQAPASPSLRALLAERPSLTWLLCNQTLWPQEGP